MNKNLIQKRFSKNLKTYNENAKIQKQMAKTLCAKIDKKEFQNILEIGCGTGLLTEIASKILKSNSYTAIDIVPDCENFIKKINPNIEFIAEDVEKFLKNTEKKYDLIISNATFQWIENFEDFFHMLFNKLNKKGVLLFSTFGKENFREIYFVIGKTLNYYSKNELQEILKVYSPKIEEEVHILSFSTPKEILKHIKQTGVNSLEETIWTKQDLKNFENGYNNFCSGRPTLTYNPIYVEIVKNI